MSSAQNPKWPVPSTERQRLRELESFDVMRTPREEPFDGLVEIAAELFDVPIALISLLDAETQWFKASVGIDVCGTSREVAFCAHAIMSDETMVVEDATLDPRFQDNPMVTGPLGVRFYAGAPLITAKGERIGTFCVKDTRPRMFERRQLRLLERLARLTVTVLEGQRLAADLGISALRRSY